MRPKIKFIAPATRDGGKIIASFISQCIQAGLDDTRAFDDFGREYDDYLKKGISYSAAIDLIVKHFNIDF